MCSLFEHVYEAVNVSDIAKSIIDDLQVQGVDLDGKDPFALIEIWLDKNRTSNKEVAKAIIQMNSSDHLTLISNLKRLMKT